MILLFINFAEVIYFMSYNNHSSFYGVRGRLHDSESVFEC